MKKNPKVEEPVTPEPVAECALCQMHKVNISKLNESINKYKEAYETLKLKLQTIFNITQL